jgi:hypothetical protein
MPERFRVTEDELRKLPLRAIVAFAGRCARRVQPLYSVAAGASDRLTHIHSVDRAINVAEIWAGGGAADDAAARAADDARAAANADAAAADDATAAFAAGLAALAADAAARAADDAARRDYEALLALQLGDFPELGRPIDPSEAGPLGSFWPWEQSGWYRTALRRLREALGKAGTVEVNEPQSFDIYVDPGNASKETIQEVLEALSDLHRAAGGLGLEFKIDGQHVMATTEVTS